MLDKKLIGLVLLSTLLSAAHTLDHVVRGDFSGPWSPALMISYAVSATIYGIVALGLYWYSRNKVGPLFWALFSTAGLAFGWFAHFSPYAEQTPETILAAYGASWGGWIAAGALVALMLSLASATVYTGYLVVARRSA